MINNNDVKSLAHTKWNSFGKLRPTCKCLASQVACICLGSFCKYHIVFALKFRRKVFYSSKRFEVGKMIRDLCKWKEVNLIEGEVCPDHIHVLVEIPPKLSISSSQRKDQHNDISEIWKYEVQI